MLNLASRSKMYVSSLDMDPGSNELSSSLGLFPIVASKLSEAYIWGK